MEYTRQAFSEENSQTMDKLIEPAKPRIRQILKQYPQGRGKVPSVHKELRHQQPKRCFQQPPQGAASEVPVIDLEPLRVLNAYRRGLGLGPSPNLISSAIYDWDPAAIAACYDKTMTSDFSCFPYNFPPIEKQIAENRLTSFRTAINSPTSEHDISSSSSSYQHESSDEHTNDTQPSTTELSGNCDSVDFCPRYMARADQ